MRATLPAMLTCLVALPWAALPVAAQGQSQAQSQPAPRLVIGAPGTCQMTVNDQPRPCTSGLVYVHHSNGSILLSVQAGRDTTIGFQAESDRQAKPEEYTLNLSRMHTSISGRTAAKQVTGTCEISMSTDGQIWHRAVCRATDRSNLVTVMTFTGSGSPVTAERPGQALQRPPGPTSPATPAPPRSKGS